MTSFAGAEQVLAYLGRYTHRVAIANHRLVRFDGEQVCFRWRDYAHGNKVKLMTLSAEEFLRRFLQHTLPPRFVRIRHYGLLANRGRQAKLTQCRTALGQPPPQPSEPESVEAMVLRLTGIELYRCRSCQQGQLRVIALLLPVRTTPSIPQLSGVPP